MGKVDRAMIKHVVQFRKQITVNTDPQRRCYNGCNFSEETIWTAWGTVAPYGTKTDAEESAACFREINKDREYRVVEQGDA